MYERLLVPFDGSEHATAALEHALELAATHDATVHALYVVDTTTSPLVVSKDDVRDALREVGEDAAGKAFAEAEALAEEYGVDLATELREGDPEDQILATITDLDVDLVVMGTHGHEGISRLLGSVTERVIRESPVPVLTVRDEGE
ncbi:universal stress protein [Halolamina sp. CBA1230]|uniref:universal stress protein n=1 Tax=Halolamina sp. CBA1230 TaxID=1853690 RepID=UPI0009A18423|nr:universal stress protein [Halolamina sp. CBA1230]QKY20459.1 universal stress protein [Halolamina sp. CBA1230]